MWRPRGCGVFIDGRRLAGGAEVSDGVVLICRVADPPGRGDSTCDRRTCGSCSRAPAPSWFICGRPRSSDDCWLGTGSCIVVLIT